MAAGPPSLCALDTAIVRWLQDVADRGLFITDTDLIVCRWNQWLAAQTGRSAADMVGRPLLELYPTLADRGFDQYYRDALGGEVRILSERFHRYLLPITRNLHGAGLTEMAQTARIEPLWDDDRIVGTITLIEDVTERVVAERELRNQIAASDQARELAEHASRLKDDFLATLSHEIRTPLNAVMGWARILRTERSVHARTRAVEVIERNAASQLRLVEDLLDMARILSGKLQLATTTVNLGDIVRSAVDVVAPGAIAKRITVDARYEPDLPAVTGDPDRLQQVAWNLMSNAVKFTPAGGSVSVEVARANDHHVQLIVRDTGQGIAREFLPYVFDRFRQADASPSRRHGGLGLGLALVRQIIELHGGAVGVDSPGLEQGATFWVTMPAAQRAGRAEPAGPEAAPVTLDGISVLIVDDEDDSRAMMLALLKQYGAEARGASSAAAALADLTGGAHPTDVLVSDLGMPETDGYALIRQIRLLPADVRAVPAIAVTAYANPDDRVRALVAGYQTHIAKPVDASLLAASIAGLVKRRNPPSA